MIHVDWKWPVAIAAFSSFALLSFFRLEPQSVVWFGIKAIIFVSFGTYGVFIICSRLLKVLSRPHSSQPGNNEELDRSAVYEARRKKAREEAQALTKEKADDYKERIMSPREEAKKKKRDEEFYRFTGQAWKLGKGDKLGGDDARCSGGEDPQSPGSEAREIRHLPPDVQLHIPKPPETTKRRVIELPEEPSEDTEDTTVIVLRTPIGTKHKRRFLRSSTLQVVLDYMTTVGFHQAAYTLSMSYPRRPLIDQSEVTLHELEFGKQMILNIEGKNV